MEYTQEYTLLFFPLMIVSTLSKWKGALSFYESLALVKSCETAGHFLLPGT